MPIGSMWGHWPCSVLSPSSSMASAIASSTAAATSCGLTMLLAFGPDPGLADHLEQVGGLLPFQERSRQCAVCLGCRLRGQKFFVKGLRLFNVAQFAVAIGQNVLKRNVLGIAPGGRFEPGSDFLFTIQRLEHPGEQLVKLDKRGLAFDMTVDQGQCLLTLVHRDERIGQQKRNLRIAIVINKPSLESLDRQVIFLGQRERPC